MEATKILRPVLKISRNLYPASNINKSVTYVSLSKMYSTQNAQAEEVVVREKIQLTKPSVTKWKRPPFAKNFFLGKFDTELLAFPEILDKEQVAELESTVKIINELYREKVNSSDIDRNKKIPDDVLQELKDLGLFGRTIPLKYGGLDLTYTACTRLNEVLGLDWSIASTLAAHEFFASQVLLAFGTENQKSKYLPNLASGKLIAALCYSEFKSGSDLLSISTVARKNADGQFVINGSKSWVANAGLAGIYIVFAKTQNAIDIKEHDISVFIVDRDAEGVVLTCPEKTSLHGVSTDVIEFEEVVVPSENLVGSLGAGFPIYIKALESFRIGLNSFTFGTLKILLDSVTEHVINTERVERSLGDVQLVRQRLSKVNSMIYGMESVSYFTAAILDSTDNPDISLESAIMKVFNSEGTLFCLQQLSQAVGSSILMKGWQLERFYRDAQGLAMFDGPNDIARLFIGLSGCKFVGAAKAEEVMKMRNVYFFPKNTVKEMIRRYRIRYNMIKFEQDIAGHIHPSFVKWGNKLEKSLQRFEVAVEELLTTHGTKIVDTQIDPVKLANIAIDLYAMSAVLSRCSRSYCIGLKNCHHEFTVACAFCFDANRRIITNISDILIGMTESNEANHLYLGEQVIDCRGYFPEHPLKHNF